MTFDFPQQGSSYIFDTQIPGPAVLITCCNHGNERLGVTIIQQLIGDASFLGSLKNGKVGFLLLNVAGYEQEKRLIDHNMNRIWNEEGTGYEFSRKEEIKDFLADHHFDYCIDLHTMSKPYGVIGICDEKDVDLIKSVLDIDQIRLDTTLGQGTFIGYFNTLGGIGMGLEAGQHKDVSGINAGIVNIKNLLIYLGILEGSLTKEKTFTGTYALVKEVFCHSKDFIYAQQFTTLHSLAPQEIIGHDGESDIRNDLDGDIYFGLATDTPMPGDGIGFLFRKIG